MKTIIGLVVLLLCVGLLIGKSWQRVENREWAEFNQSVMTIERFMELNPYFSNKAVCVGFKTGTLGPMFDAHNLSYRLFIKPFKYQDGDWSGQNMDILFL